MTRQRGAKRASPARLPAFPSDVLALVNTMERSTEPYEVARAALTHAALTRRPVPDYSGALHADRHADVVLSALYRRGMLDA